MERLTSLGIRKAGYPTLSSIFTYDDSFIDAGLRFYDFKQALHLYLKKNGYETIVFYNTAEGFSSFEKEMLQHFLTEIKETESEAQEPRTSEHVEIRPEQRGRRSGSRLGSRMRKREAGESLRPDDGQPVVVDAPQLNLWLDAQTQRWHRNMVGNRIASLDQIIYNLARRRHLAIIVDASDQEPEFDSTSTDKLVRSINNVQNMARMNGKDANDNRLLILINAQACRRELMRLFFSQNDYPVTHKSVFMQDYFRSHMLTHIDDSYKLNFKTAFPLGQPTKNDIKHVLLRARLDFGIDKPMEWAGIDEICEQMALRDKWTLTDLYNDFSTKSEYTYESLEVERRGDAEEEMRRLIGLDSILEQINRLKAGIQLKLDRGEDPKKINKHMLFLGNPGTGKTTVARFIGSIFKDMGLVEKGHVVEVSREDLVAGYVGQTAIKTQKVVDSALGGILFVDEAYRLAQGGENDFGPEAIETIMKRMEDDSARLVVIFAGYEDDMKSLYEVNTGVDSRFPTKIMFRDYRPEELKEIFMLRARKHYSLTPETDCLLDRIIEYAMDYKSRSNDIIYKFGNARWVRNLFEKVEANVALRKDDSDTSVLIPDDFLNTGLKELDGFNMRQEDNASEKTNEQKLMEMVGLQEVKAEINNIIDLARSFELYRNAGIDVTDDMKPSMHMVFSGNPGTGKTTVARLMGQIYKEHGLLSQGHVVEIENRGKIVDAYQGHTAIKVNKIVDEARGGVLFIDEIYALARDSRDTFGIEAIDTLITRIENERDDMVVILAGYKELMSQFLDSNPGMQSRFNRYINFTDYSAQELYMIAEGFLKGEKKNFNINQTASDHLQGYILFAKENMDHRSGNGRWARNLSEHIRQAHNSRVSKLSGITREELLTYTEKDVTDGIERFEKSQLTTQNREKYEHNKLSGVQPAT